jgi:hypothetical protein
MPTSTATKPLDAKTGSTNGTGTRKQLELKVPLPEYTIFSLRLEGTSPLIVDAFSEEAKRKLAESQSGAAKVKPGPRDPEREFEGSRYMRPDGKPGIPKLAFRKSIQAAAIRMTETKGTEVLAAFQIDTPDELLPLEAGEPVMRTDHVVRVGRGNLAYRAQYFPWSVVLPVKLDHEVVSLDQFIHIVSKAGMGVGVGNWRAEKKGDFGLWQISAISEVRIESMQVIGSGTL